MTTYTVLSAEKADVWSNEYGQFQAWNIQLREGEREPENATTNTKLGNDFVTVGETVEGELSNGRFKRAKPANVGGSTSGNSYKRDPAETASIVRQHSQTAAVYYAAILQKAHPDIDPHYDWLRGIIDWFFEDAMKAAGRW